MDCTVNIGDEFYYFLKRKLFLLLPVRSFPQYGDDVISPKFSGMRLSSKPLPSEQLDTKIKQMAMVDVRGQRSDMNQLPGQYTGTAQTRSQQQTAERSQYRAQTRSPRRYLDSAQEPNSQRTTAVNQTAFQGDGR